MRGLVRLAAAAALAAGLAGCALDSDNISATLMADPLKYEFYTCKQMDGQMKSLEAQEQKLRDLIARAERDTGGVLVATAAYRNDYVRNRADMKVLKDTQDRRECTKQAEHQGSGAAH